MLDINRPYRRVEIDLAFAKRKAIMHFEAVKKGNNGLALYQDCYTGKVLRGGDLYDYEHIRSSEEIFTKYKSTFTDLQIAEIVNCPENVAVTLTVINKSKGKYRMEDWLVSKLNKLEFEIDHLKTHDSLKKADLGILRMVTLIK